MPPTIQWLFEILTTFPTKREGRYSRKVAQALSSVAARSLSRALHDPIVNYPVHGARLAMPMSHALPRILLRHPDYSANLGRIADALFSKYPNLTMIDIGANIGDTAAIIRKTLPIPILCIDGDPTFFQLLKRNVRQWKDIELEHSYVGAKSGTIPARMNSRDGSGHLTIDSHQQTDVKGLLDIIKLHPRFLSAKLLKLDTDGLDTIIVKGAVNFLCAAQPAIYIEYDPFFFLRHDPSGFDVFECLRRAGYETALFFRNTGEIHAEVSLVDEESLHELHEECSNQGGKRYFDICFFHRRDIDLSRAIRKAEFSRQSR